MAPCDHRRNGRLKAEEAAGRGVSGYRKLHCCGRKNRYGKRCGSKGGAGDDCLPRLQSAGARRRAVLQSLRGKPLHKMPGLRGGGVSGQRLLLGVRTEAVRNKAQKYITAAAFCGGRFLFLRKYRPAADLFLFYSARKRAQYGVNANICCACMMNCANCLHILCFGDILAMILAAY